MTASKPHRRKIMMIDPKFQWRYLRRILTLMFAIVVVSVFFALVVHNLMLTTIAGPYWTNMFICVLVMCAIFIGALVWIGVRISHRMAGPLYRIRVTLLEIASGNLPQQCRVRQGDEHVEVAEALSQALSTIRAKRDEETAAWRDQAQRLRALLPEAPVEVSEQLEKMAEEAEARGTAD